MITVTDIVVGAIWSNVGTLNIYYLGWTKLDFLN